MIGRTRAVGWRMAVRMAATLGAAFILVVLGVRCSANPVAARGPAAAGRPASTVPVDNSQLATASTQAASGYNPANVEQLHDVVIGTGGGRELHAEIAWPKVRPEGPMPVLLQFHGGGWHGGNHKTAVLYKVFAEQGYFGASIEYRLTGEARWPAQIEDCKLAVRWIRANAQKYHINPDAIGIVGGSAGGHLVCCMATLDEANWEGTGGYPGVSSKVQAVVDVNGPTDLIAFSSDGRVLSMFGKKATEMPEAYRQASPLFHVHPGMPPFLIIHGDKDTGVALTQSTTFADALKKANVPAELIVIKDGTHELNILRPDISGNMLRFCDQYLRPKAAHER